MVGRVTDNVQWTVYRKSHCPLSSVLCPFILAIMKRLLPLLAVALLAACTTQLSIRGPNSQSSEAPSSVTTSEPQALEYGDADVPETATSTGALLREIVSERILPTGIVELGDSGAPHVMLLFTHHSCTYCHTFGDERLPRLIKDFVEQGKLRLQIAQLNIRKYPQSELQLRSLICATAQGAGLDMHGALFNQSTWDEKSMTALARKLNLKETVFTACMHAPGTTAAVQLQQSLAQSLGVTLVPTYFIDGEKFVGLPQYPELRGRVEEALAG